MPDNLEAGSAVGPDYAKGRVWVYLNPKLEGSLSLEEVDILIRCLAYASHLVRMKNNGQP